MRLCGRTFKIVNAFRYFALGYFIIYWAEKSMFGQKLGRKGEVHVKKFDRKVIFCQKSWEEKSIFSNVNVKIRDILLLP